MEKIYLLTMSLCLLKTVFSLIKTVWVFYKHSNDD